MYISYFYAIYPAAIPNIALKMIIIIGCTFLNDKISAITSIPAETYVPAALKISTANPSGINTSLPTDITEAPISPTTAGLSPLIHPFIMPLSLNFL